MFFREDVESRPVEDKDFDAKDALDEILRRKITPHANTIATVLAAWCCHPQALLAVKELEHWAAWEWALTFATESHTVMHSLCEDIASGRAAALWAMLQWPLPVGSSAQTHSGNFRRQSRAGSAPSKDRAAAVFGERTSTVDGDVVSMIEREAEVREGFGDAAETAALADSKAGPMLFIAHDGAQAMLPAEEAARRVKQAAKGCARSVDGIAPSFLLSKLSCHSLLFGQYLFAS
jgi:hypothetical protein